MPEKSPIRPKEGPYKATRGPLRPTKGLPSPGPTKGSIRPEEDLFKSKDLDRRLTADHLSPTNGPLQAGVALACIGVAHLEVGVALATLKVYKSPLLQIRSSDPIS